MSRWAIGLAALFSLGCSLLYSPPSWQQCVRDADCEAQPQLSGLSCDTEHGVCVRRTALVAGCESTAACIEENEGRAALCRYPGGPCLNIETPDCPRVSGDWQAADTLLLGSVGPHTAVWADGNSPPVEYTQRLLQAIDLGIEEWQQEVSEGLSFSQRPLAMLHCNSNAEPAVAQRAMNHLVNDIRAPVVLALTEFEHEALLPRALETKTALVCVECQGPAPLPPQLEAGLVWRMSPPFENQAALSAWRLADLEERIRRARGLATATPIRVAVWSDEGPAFDAFLRTFRALARFNDLSPEQNGANYLELRNLDWRYQAQDQLVTTRRIAAFAPDIVVAAMDVDFTSYYLRMVESEWPAASPRPQYLTTLLNQELELLAPIVADNEDLRLRVSGTGLWLDENVARNRAAFELHYRQRYGQPPGRTASGYDAWYATALAIYSADAGGSLAGTNIAAHFWRLTSGPVVDAEPGALATAKVYLSAQENIDLTGASSRLNWNTISLRVEEELGLWCLSRGASGELQLSDAGLRWTSSGASGSYQCPGGQ